MTATNTSIAVFAKLGTHLTAYLKASDEVKKTTFEQLHQAVSLSKHHNGWFTSENVAYSLEYWSNQLTIDKLNTWLAAYPKRKSNSPKRIAVIAAGNIPLVGFHDFLCALLAGHHVVVRLSSNDKILLPAIADYLIFELPSLAQSIVFEENRLTDFDAVIATGSTNTSRYFEYYFGKKPHIIRKNRNSVAVLTGTESEEELQLLGQDIFKYYGLGCRNISKIYVPKDYNFDIFYKAIYSFKGVLDHHKYANNYDYNKAVYLMGTNPILDNGFLLLKEDKSLSSPIGSLFYEYYGSEQELEKILLGRKTELQCIVSKSTMPNSIDFGQTQVPNIDDYADGIDTLQFLLEI